MNLFRLELPIVDKYLYAMSTLCQTHCTSEGVARESNHLDNLKLIHIILFCLHASLSQMVAKGHCISFLPAFLSAYETLIH